MNKIVETNEAKPVHVIWRRPDGFHGAHPSDFRVAEIGDSRIWLHKRDRDEFPFKISGGWGESDDTKRLNNLINAIDDPEDSFIRLLERTFDHSVEDNPTSFVSAKIQWIGELGKRLKGDTWEVEIMRAVLTALAQKIQQCSIEFVRRSTRS